MVALFANIKLVCLCMPRAVRELAGESLSRLTVRAPEYMSSNGESFIYLVFSSNKLINYYLLSSLWHILMNGVAVLQDVKFQNFLLILSVAIIVCFFCEDLDFLNLQIECGTETSAQT